MSDMPAAPTPITVAEFSQRMSGVFNRVAPFRDIAVSGEITGYAVHGSGIYFDLQDQGAQGGAILACYLRPGSLPRDLKLGNGLAVVARGEIINYAPRSRYSMTVMHVEATGLGMLHVEFQALKERLQREGLFEAHRKRHLPRFPLRIAVVSTRDGKGIDDFLTEIARRAPFVAIEFFESRVQGIGAEREIAAAIARADGSGADVIVVGRGGGSYEDLFTFNREEVVRAILGTRAPVLTALAHTADVHLADFAADATANTPSLAVDRILEHWMHAQGWLPSVTERLVVTTRRRFDLAAQRLDGSRRDLSEMQRQTSERRRLALLIRERALMKLDPRARLAERSAALATHSEQLHGGAVAMLQRFAHRIGAQRAWLPSRTEALFARKQTRFEIIRTAFAASDPALPLQRGYAMVLRGGQIVRDAAKLSIGDEIHARFGRGGARARIERIEHEEGPQ